MREDTHLSAEAIGGQDNSAKTLLPLSPKAGDQMLSSMASTLDTQTFCRPFMNLISVWSRTQHAISCTSKKTGAAFRPLAAH